MIAAANAMSGFTNTDCIKEFSHRLTPIFTDLQETAAATQFSECVSICVHLWLKTIVSVSMGLYAATI